MRTTTTSAASAAQVIDRVADEHGLTLAQLGALLGVPAQTISSRRDRPLAVRDLRSLTLLALALEAGATLEQLAEADDDLVRRARRRRRSRGSP